MEEKKIKCFPNGTSVKVVANSKLPHIPKELKGLKDLSYNLWWSWNPEARMIFKQLDPVAWKQSMHNPIKMLKDLPIEFFERAIENPKYMHRYGVIMHRFEQYITYCNGWFSENYHEHKRLIIAYFSAEYGIHHSLPFYAGGLGVLAGDYLKECSDLGIPLVAVGFMYSKGYLHQHIRSDGWQENREKTLDRDVAPIDRVLDMHGKQLVIKVPHITPSIYVAVWKVQVGRVPLYLIDTDIEQNLQENRSISSLLYAGDTEQRLKQEIVLGIGGRKILCHLGIDYSAVHLNEGHSAFVLIERVRERVENGVDYEVALKQVKKTSFFTTHTPVAAGHDVFSFDLIDKYFNEYYGALGIEREEFLKLGNHPEHPDKGFDMTVFAMRMTEYHNGVSKKHGEVARKMWNCLWPDISEEKNVPIDAITNGVHLPRWINHKMKLLFDTYLNPICGDWQKEHDNPLIWNLIDEIPDKELWNTKKWLKSKMFSRMREYSQLKWAEKRSESANLASEGALLNQDILTIGFARRFATYKRADLIFHDLDRIKKIVNNSRRPVQFVFAGKSHPEDDEGKRILQRVYKFAQDPEFGGRIAFIEDYGSRIAQYLVHGVDVWLNNPIIPMEACGTSGMKVALNGGINLSSHDGWWIEGYNGKNGWTFGSEFVEGDRDKIDANSIYDIIEKEVAPLYYSTKMNAIPHEWIKMMKESIKSVAPKFCTRRMVKEYMSMYYPHVLKNAKQHI
ncbi:MAG: alpha-glucan family phosphorylase [Methanosarcinaceae archaeon]|nr:alpha-glucan family phosphorylase [Methanosarcinaceae archaeon]